ncbi:MAG TPA: FAD binding domain-containing protein [Holophaga sp.]|nr:FAD binding domain-containing protein [Holophaga sp.]HPS68817.1 FAD binding domain-containing protein [Holophaga sp.]
MKTPIASYERPSGVEEALAARRKNPAAAWLAGGTFLLAGDFRDKPASVIDVGRILPRGIAASDGILSIGAGATFQEIADSPAVPGAFRDAALGMNHRNTRNRATLGGNLGANKSCASFIPLLLVLEAVLETSEGRAGAAEWLARPAGLVLGASMPLERGRATVYRRWSRTACDIAVLSAAVSLTMKDGAVAGLRIAMGGLGPHVRRFPELETLFEGKDLPGREAIESMAAPLLSPLDDLRGSAAFKRLRAAALLADALHDARKEASK